MENNTLQHNYLSIPLPNGWEDASQVIARGPEVNGFRINLIFSQEPTEFGETAEDFAARQLPQLAAALPNYEVIEEGPKRFGPNSGYLRQYKFTMDQGDIGQLQFYCVLEGRCYTFTFTSLRKDIEQAKSVAERMFAQVRLLPSSSTRALEDF